MIRSLFDIKYLKRRAKNNLSGPTLSSQFNVLNRKRIRTQKPFYNVFMRQINPRYPSYQDEEDGLRRTYSIPPLQFYYFRKRTVLTGSYRGLIEFFMAILLIIFKFCVYIFTITFIFFSLTKYFIIELSRYLITNKYSKNPKYHEYYYSLFDRLQLTKNAYNSYKNKKVDLINFYDLYLTDKQKKEINDFEFPTGFYPFEEKITQPLIYSESDITDAERKFLLWRSKDKKNRKPNYVQVGDILKEVSPTDEFKEREKKLNTKHNLILDKMHAEAQEHLIKNMEYTFALDKKTHHLLQKSGTEVLNPFDRLEILNNIDKGTEFYTYPKQSSDNIFNTIYRFNKIKEPITYFKSLFSNDLDMFNSYHQHDYDNIYFSDSKHVFIANNTNQTDYFKNLKQKEQENLYNETIQEHLNYKKEYYKNINKKFYEQFFFEETLENILQDDGNCFEDIRHDITSWSTYDMETTILTERILYPYMEFFWEHDTEFYLSRYAYSNLLFSSLYPEPRLLNRLAKRRAKRVKYFNNLHMKRGKKYEKALFFKPIDINKKKKKFFTIKELDLMTTTSSAIQFDFETFFLYLYFFLKEENSPIIIIIDKFISIFF